MKTLQHICFLFIALVIASCSGGNSGSSTPAAATSIAGIIDSEQDYLFQHEAFSLSISAKSFDDEESVEYKGFETGEDKVDITSLGNNFTLVGTPLVLHFNSTHMSDADKPLIITLPIPAGVDMSKGIMPFIRLMGSSVENGEMHQKKWRPFIGKVDAEKRTITLHLFRTAENVELVLMQFRGNATDQSLHISTNVKSAAQALSAQTNVGKNIPEGEEEWYELPWALVCDVSNNISDEHLNTCQTVAGEFLAPFLNQVSQYFKELRFTPIALNFALLEEIRAVAGQDFTTSLSAELDDRRPHLPIILTAAGMCPVFTHSCYDDSTHTIYITYDIFNPNEVPFANLEIADTLFKSFISQNYKGENKTDLFSSKMSWLRNGMAIALQDAMAPGFADQHYGERDWKLALNKIDDIPAVIWEDADGNQNFPALTFPDRQVHPVFSVPSIANATGNPISYFSGFWKNLDGISYEKIADAFRGSTGEIFPNHLKDFYTAQKAAGKIECPVVEARADGFASGEEKFVWPRTHPMASSCMTIKSPDRKKCMNLRRLGDGIFSANGLVPTNNAALLLVSGNGNTLPLSAADGVLKTDASSLTLQYISNTNYEVANSDQLETTVGITLEDCQHDAFEGVWFLQSSQSEKRSYYPWRNGDADVDVSSRDYSQCLTPVQVNGASYMIIKKKPDVDNTYLIQIRPSILSSAGNSNWKEVVVSGVEQNMLDFRLSYVDFPEIGNSQNITAFSSREHLVLNDSGNISNHTSGAYKLKMAHHQQWVNVPYEETADVEYIKLFNTINTPFNFAADPQQAGEELNCHDGNNLFIEGVRYQDWLEQQQQP
ncbi:MAG: hypothetical protein COV43_02285 [Deltaproteobacteria bacterium CG11_big_fil_rev_8_21_14_0_20_42_23]|nr:MAG: hypothetical protein COV43_02285 [Deltaproteobacteria bacterium CG11_big_fil_rev_8_21_14_0_20_42_23]PJC64754.1 MAG: hypothetical protein CO021_02820 [Deltaproteobacteria bacterium CG_4_9_14_0_2_um_filter_42_21]